jgi:light-regulated signal transduction histidine kinase (bacteriophytochrome)
MNMCNAAFLPQAQKSKILSNFSLIIMNMCNALKNWLSQIVDVNSHPVPIVPLNNPITQEPIDLSFSTLRSVSPIHIKYLQKMGVSASLCISLISDDKLWGMIVGHH